MGVVSPVEWEWREWRLRENRYRNYTGSRPAHFPRLIPPAWWARLVLFVARRKPVAAPVPPLGPYARPVALYRNPRGGVENVAAAAQAGLGVALLCLDYWPESWATVRERCDQNNILYGYWYHCRTVQDIDWLLSISHGRPVVGLNIEKELETVLTPNVVAERLTASGYAGSPCLITYGWVPNDVDFRPTGNLPTFLEMFPQDDPNLWPPTITTDACADHARDNGAQRPIPMWGAYRMSETAAARIRDRGFKDVTAGPASPAWYPKTMYPTGAVYTVDDTGENWAAWGWK